MSLPGIFNAGDFIPSLGWNDKLTGLDAKAELVVRKFRKFLCEMVDEPRKMEETSIGSGGEEGGHFVDVLLEIEQDQSVGFAPGADSIRALISVSTHPRDILQTEIHEIADRKPIITDEDLEKMHYLRLRAVVKENLCLSRLSTQDIKI
ncbi:hypothetical protein ACJRO7_015052 [Eucalyptus globulus]|uniref:Cytochrome P450 n=1 Tax=Eucalyptus globulus TaxID=34317 RepID=A0ABD3L2A5_EUCGL